MFPQHEQLPLLHPPFFVYMPSVHYLPVSDGGNMSVFLALVSASVGLVSFVCLSVFCEKFVCMTTSLKENHS